MKRIKIKLTGDERTVSDIEAETMIKAKKAVLVSDLKKEKAVKNDDPEKRGS